MMNFLGKRPSTNDESYFSKEPCCVYIKIHDVVFEKKTINEGRGKDYAKRR